MRLIDEGTVIGLSQKTKNGKFFNLNGLKISFSIEESIYSLNRLLTLGGKDGSGEAYHYHLFDPGCFFDLSLSVGSKNFNNSYRVISSTYGESGNTSIYSPQVNMQLLSTWPDDINLKTKKHSNRISNIVRNFASDYNFEIDVNDTGNEYTWYQLQESDKDFLERISKYCYSDNSFSSPFFLYQTQDNVLHLRNGYSLENQREKLSFVFSGMRSMSSAMEYTISSLKRIDDRSFSSRKLVNTRGFGLSRETGSIETIDLLATSIPSQRASKKVLIANAEDSSVTRLENFMFQETGNQNEENQLGLMTNKFKESFFTEKYMISIPTNEKIFSLRAGDKIGLIIPGESSTNKSLSQGYIIEKKIDVYNSTDKSLLTILVIGRRLASIPSSDPNQGLFT